MLNLQSRFDYFLRLTQANVTLKSFEIAQLINLTPANNPVIFYCCYDHIECKSAYSFEFTIYVFEKVNRKE